VGQGVSWTFHAAAPTRSQTPVPARRVMIFLVSPSGHEHYQRELAGLMASARGPLADAVAEFRARHDIEQLTPQAPGRPPVPNVPTRAPW
jgi:hypothetical protein